MTVRDEASGGAKQDTAENAISVPVPDQMRVVTLTPDLAIIDYPIPEPHVPPCLSAAEREVALALFDNASHREIARARGVSVKTVGNQVARIYQKLGITSRIELVMYLKEPGMRAEAVRRKSSGGRGKSDDRGPPSRRRRGSR